MGSHTKKRPHNLVLGRFFDGHLYDALELGVEGYKSIKAFGNAGTGAGLGNKVRARTRNSSSGHLWSPVPVPVPVPVPAATPCAVRLR